MTPYISETMGGSIMADAQECLPGLLVEIFLVRKSSPSPSMRFRPTRNSGNVRGVSKNMTQENFKNDGYRIRPVNFSFPRIYELTITKSSDTLEASTKFEFTEKVLERAKFVETRPIRPGMFPKWTEL
jgi:hypothetical protein